MSRIANIQCGICCTTRVVSRVRGVGEAGHQAVGPGLAQVALELAVQLVVLVVRAEADQAVGLAHQLLEQSGELLVVARAVAEDHPQRDAVEQLLPLVPLQRAAEPEPVDLVGHHAEEMTGERVHALGGGEHGLVERAPVPPLLPA